MSDLTWICLAAGQGRRLRPITDDKPKAMVSVAGRPIIDWLIETARSAGIDDLCVVTGYEADLLESHVGDEVRVFENSEYDTTDMVRSLWCAREAFDGPVIVTYSDILYTPDVLRSVIASSHDITVTVDDEWREYWEHRHEDPVSDAESLELDANDRIESIGQRVDSIEAPEAQYVGLMKFSAEGTRIIRDAYEAAERAAARGQRPFDADRSFDELHATDLLQGLIDRGHDLYATRIEGGWIEIDTLDDLEIARDVCHSTDDGNLEIDRAHLGTDNR